MKNERKKDPFLLENLNKPSKNGCACLLCLSKEKTLSKNWQSMSKEFPDNGDEDAMPSIAGGGVEVKKVWQANIKKKKQKKNKKTKQYLWYAEQMLTKVWAYTYTCIYIYIYIYILTQTRAWRECILWYVQKNHSVYAWCMQIIAGD